MRTRATLLAVAAAFGGVALLTFPDTQEPMRSAVRAAPAAPELPAVAPNWEGWTFAPPTAAERSGGAAAGAPLLAEPATTPQPEAGIWATPAEFSETN